MSVSLLHRFQHQGFAQQWVSRPSSKPADQRAPPLQRFRRVLLRGVVGQLQLAPQCPAPPYDAGKEPMTKEQCLQPCSTLEACALLVNGLDVNPAAASREAPARAENAESAPGS
mmetsp:Transcript_105693/g.187966  ORF Transcript_105693/g.187966 Transcript_105693/m.187966 type:complete len:114 (+) Transcript_105693:571-912(+)